MEDDLNQHPNKLNNNLCINCGNPHIVEGYPNKLCADCRNKFIKFPVPLWVKLFGTGIVLVMLVSAVWLPGNLKAAIAISRAEKAEDESNYLNEQKELEKAKSIVPGSIDVLSHLVISSYYNEDYKVLDSAADEIGSTEISDSSLYNKVSNILVHYKEFFPADSFNVYIEKYKKTTIPDTVYQDYLKKNPQDIFSIYSLANSYDDQGKYSLADSLISECLSIDPDFLPALNFKTSIKRSLNQIDSSIYYCNKIIEINHQSVYALSSKARTFLKIGKKQQALLLAKKGYDLDPSVGYNLATLALAYHLNNDFKKRDEIINLSKRDSSNASYMQYAKDVIANKEKL